MLVRGYFAHKSADGSPFWKRIKTFYAEPRYGYWSVGENLFWASGSVTADASMKAWMASPGHRANILNPAWRQIGIAAVSSPDAPGTFSDLGVTVITTDFGVRSLVLTPWCCRHHPSSCFSLRARFLFFAALGRPVPTD